MDVRRIADGVKVALRFKTTDQVERAFVEDRKHQYMYQDSEGFHFMNMESYDQVALPADIIGDQAAYLQPEMEVTISMHDAVPVAIELPPRATLEVVETEPSRARPRLRLISPRSSPTACAPWCRRLSPPAPRSW
jgi:elongation factor P